MKVIRTFVTGKASGVSDPVRISRFALKDVRQYITRNRPGIIFHFPRAIFFRMINLCRCLTWLRRSAVGSTDGGLFRRTRLLRAGWQGGSVDGRHAGDGKPATPFGGGPRMRSSSERSRVPAGERAGSPTQAYYPSITGSRLRPGSKARESGPNWSYGRYDTRAKVRANSRRRARREAERVFEGTKQAMLSRAAEVAELPDVPTSSRLPRLAPPAAPASPTEAMQLLLGGDSNARSDVTAADDATSAHASGGLTARDVRLAALADDIWSQGGSYAGTATNITFLPKANPAIPEIMICGSERCGKTALLKALFKSHRPVSQGTHRCRRDAMNFYDVGCRGTTRGTPVFRIIETPGYGRKAVHWNVLVQYAAVLRNLMVSGSRPSLKMTYYLLTISSAAGVAARDLDMLKYLAAAARNFTIVITKVDLVSGDEAVRDAICELQRHGVHHPVMTVSSVSLGGVDDLRFDMVKHALHALPFERLTLPEAKALGQRLLSQMQWRAIVAEQRASRIEAAASPLAPAASKA